MSSVYVLVRFWEQHVHEKNFPVSNFIAYVMNQTELFKNTNNEK